MEGVPPLVRQRGCAEPVAAQAEHGVDSGTGGAHVGGEGAVGPVFGVEVAPQPDSDVAAAEATLSQLRAQLSGEGRRFCAKL